MINRYRNKRQTDTDRETERQIQEEQEMVRDERGKDNRHHVFFPFLFVATVVVVIPVNWR